MIDYAVRCARRGAAGLAAAFQDIPVRRRDARRGRVDVRNEAGGCLAAISVWLPLTADAEVPS